MLVLLIAGYNVVDSDSVTDAAVNSFNSADFLAEHAGLISLLNLAFGCLGAYLFVKFQKVCIMLGTSFLGADLVWTGIFQGFAHALPGAGQMFLIIATGAGFFCVQWFKTSKGVEIDPQTGKVTVVVIQAPLPAGGPVNTAACKRLCSLTAFLTRGWCSRTCRPRYLHSRVRRVMEGLPSCKLKWALEWPCSAEIVFCLVMPNCYSNLMSVGRSQQQVYQQQQVQQYAQQQVQQQRE